jgi:hypothetical protein
MSKFAIVASLAIFAMGAVVGRATTPMPVMASETVAAISIDELTQRAGPLPVQVADAI